MARTLASIRVRLILVIVAVTNAACVSTGGSAAWYEEHIEAETALAVPHVPQTSQTDCGVAALTGVMNYYQGPLHAHQSLLDTYPPASSRGYSLGELRDIAHSQGFAAFVVPGDAAFLRRQLDRQRPLIVALKVDGASPPIPGIAALSARLVEPLLNRAMDTSYDHYVVVAGLDEQQGLVIVVDPARGPVVIDLDAFTAAWQEMNNATLLVGQSGPDA